MFFYLTDLTILAISAGEFRRKILFFYGLIIWKKGLFLAFIKKGSVFIALIKKGLLPVLIKKWSASCFDLKRVCFLLWLKWVSFLLCLKKGLFPVTCRMWPWPTRERRIHLKMKSEFLNGILQIYFIIISISPSHP